MLISSPKLHRKPWKQQQEAGLSTGSCLSSAAI